MSMGSIGLSPSKLNIGKAVLGKSAAHRPLEGQLICALVVTTIIQGKVRTIVLLLVARLSDCRACELTPYGTM